MCVCVRAREGGGRERGEERGKETENESTICVNCCVHVLRVQKRL